MKKLFLALILINSSAVLSYSVRQDETGARYCVKNTGLYGVYVKGMPFWKFWNYPRAIRTLADKTEKAAEGVQQNIDLGWPVFYTRNYQEAEQLKNDLLSTNCALEIREIALLSKTEEEAKLLELRIELMKL